jgi:hypothetical protein
MYTPLGMHGHDAALEVSRPSERNDGSTAQLVKVKTELEVARARSAP